MQRILDTTGPLGLDALDPGTVLEGNPRAGTRPLTELGGLEVGIWEMSAGVATDVEVDEVFIVLSGSATVVIEDGETLELAPGTGVRLFAGDRTTWTVHETLRKLYLA